MSLAAPINARREAISQQNMEDALRPPSFLIDTMLWEKFNTELRAACHWCTHHHTTTPAEAAKQLERGEGWPRDWVSRKVKNSTRQFGGLFICPAPDCSGHSNTKGERRRRWFCRFCINRHLGVDLRNFFQLDEAQGRWIQVPNRSCWHCQAKLGDAECVNCPQKHAKRAKRANGLVAAIPRALLGSSTHLLGASSGAVPALLTSGNDASYDGATSEARGQRAEAQSMDESNFAAANGQMRLSLAQTSSDIRILSAPKPHQRNFFVEKGLINRHLKARVLPSLIEFLNKSYTPFHATLEARRHLLRAGFQQLRECDEWTLEQGGRYFFTRNMASIFAFAVGHKYVPGGGFHAVAAHTDSPCPKLKPVSAGSKGGFLHLRVQTYGSGLWHTWLDRDLSVAGRVIIRKKGGEIAHELVSIHRPILRIPTLALCLDRLAPYERIQQDIDSQLAPILATQIENELSVSCESESSMPVEHENSSIHSNPDAHHPLLLQVLAEELGCDVHEIADFELSVYDTQPGCVGGAREEFVFSGRLDNLASAFCGLWALLDTCAEPASLVDESCIRMVALFDNGEVGSDAQSAGPQTMFQAMNRIARWFARGSKIEGAVERSIRRSFIVSADSAHALHPSQADNDTEIYQPKLRQGLVIKHDPAQNNASDAVSSFLFKEVALRSCIPTQQFAVTSEMGCSSTIDPIISAGYGVRVVDCGIPQLSMHSVREMCGTEDLEIAFRHFRAFFQDFTSIDEQLKVDG